MARLNSTSRRNPEQETFDIRSLLDHVGDGFYVKVNGASCEGVDSGDIVLIDHASKVPKYGDLVAYGEVDDLIVGRYRGGDTKEIFGVAAFLIRRFESPAPRKAKRRTRPRESQREDAAMDLQAQLEKLERVPENEAERFRIETEIYRLEQASEEWPEVIAA